MFLHSVFCFNSKNISCVLNFYFCILEQPVVASESAKNVSEVQINPETNLGEGNAAGNFAKAETKKADISGDARDAAASHPEDETGVDYVTTHLAQAVTVHTYIHTYRTFILIVNSGNFFFFNTV